MVTGAAGSIGSELCRQLLPLQPKKLVCLDRDETALFYLRLEVGSENSLFYPADYTHQGATERLLSAHGVDVIFHAAAFKHLPLMEDNPREAIRNNVLGLYDFIQVAEQSACKTFLFLSSDKAVNPSSVMGATKRAGELILSSRRSSMKCLSIRSGNVLGSQGSVLPVFVKQLAEHNRLTITHPDATRRFITVSEAASLILQAIAVGKDRDILVFDVAPPTRITDLARAIIQTAGKSESDVEIAFTGLRPGEKIHEELLSEGERRSPTSAKHIIRVEPVNVSRGELESGIAQLSDALPAAADCELREMLKELVPEYRSEAKLFAQA